MGCKKKRKEYLTFSNVRVIHTCMNRMTKISGQQYSRQHNVMLSSLSVPLWALQQSVLSLPVKNNYCNLFGFSWSQLLIICLCGVEGGLLEEDKNKFLIQKLSLHAFTLWKINLTLLGTVVCAQKNMRLIKPYSVTERWDKRVKNMWSHEALIYRSARLSPLSSVVYYFYPKNVYSCSVRFKLV